MLVFKRVVLAATLLAILPSSRCRLRSVKRNMGRR